MSTEKTRPWIVILLVLILLVFILVGGYALYHDASSILGYLFLGLGLGGLIAGWGALMNHKENK
ncbi:hypothetical protein [Acinetobacter populi]|jgi:hypothetical protein|uniref:Uncharacterized protein n=1 Tax=Acinetobacter populi TaxID=1582270 RepID=A0A1Z9YYA0_9GAMM|nr:hypothetical protein [Acinetobacter populi]MCH4247215.1 hypothetical protein [Acinetobacter populi]OUY07173.1 hypothetical protein CAP51_10850 [Acinetobacter populi]